MAVDLSIETALLLERWQGIVNSMAQVAEVPCVLINRLDKNEICQAVGSVSVPTFYCGEPVPLALNTYCSQVISSNQPLLVENAIGTRYENNNPTFAAGFSYYYGLPLLWPREGANKRGNSSRLTQSFHFFMFEPIFSPVNASNQPI